MAIEIAIRTVNQGLRQAIFINESELDGPLSEVRSIIAKQELEVPQDYRFLSRTRNVVSWAVEDTLILRTIVFSGSKEDDTKKEHSERSSVKLETPDSDDTHANESVEDKGKGLCALELWIVARGEFPNMNVGIHHADDAKKEPGGPLQGVREEGGNCQLCPWKAFLKFTQDFNSPQNIFKLMFFVVVLLFLVLAALVLATHVTFGILSRVTSHPDFHSVMSGLKSDSGSAEEVVNLRLKMSELELSWKFKFDKLNGKLTELEDLYLNDLAKHKREMASLRNQRVDISRNFATLQDLETLQAKVDQMSEYVNTHQGLKADKTQHKKKKGKKNEGKEEL